MWMLLDMYAMEITLTWQTVQAKATETAKSLGITSFKAGQG
jgi:hypothetical protein